MNTIIMNQDVHTPAFVKADASNKSDNIKQQPTSPKQVRRFSWTGFIELAILLSIVICAIWLISKVCRLCHCRLSDTALYSQDNSKSDNYTAEYSLLASDTLCHPAMRALRSTAL